ncbi:iron-containing alcohol dehydrogenase [Microbulbifer bruguierae]|uniref:Iron-containing alcohol dehydrogenase n=1 Tax=Microbulbifer bruguierae TaxID=3029061 RepID=A0ABY8N8W0_9GAMM|nr:iron-containing alcohol dehydrogenase [Microbulbifer bruguierae]WGL15070.1 iron-containing alcohol dehydrogenase [Microbulbifer bruguierae]
MKTFSFSTTNTILCEVDGAARLAQHCRATGASRVLLVTDAGILNAGLLDGLLPGFDCADLRLGIFDRVEADPKSATVEAAVHAARALGAELIVGFGGGSSMDVAKVVAVLAHPDCRQSLDELYGVGNVRGPRLPLLQVPTTAGTGSEVTPIAIVTTGETTKAGIVSPHLQPDIALLDPKLTLGLPPAVTAATGIDAMVHAIEAYTSAHKKNPVSDMLAREALRLLASNIATATHNGTDLKARGDMLLGALYAGQAFANAPVAAVHALAYPLGGHFHIPHGLSNSLVLPQVMRFNAPAAAPLYAQLAPLVMGGDCRDGGPEQMSEALIGWLENLIAELGLPCRLRDCGVTEESLPQLAADAMQQQRLLVNNPRAVSEADALAMYRAAY